MLAGWSGRPIAEVRQEIRAAGVPEGPVAAALSVEAGSHALEIARHYLDRSGQPLTISVSLHPGDRFTYASRLRRAG